MTLVLTAEVKRLFIDRDRVIRQTDRIQRRAFARIGGYVRTTSKRSIRKRKRSSLPGKPPSSHSGELKGGIFFAYEPKRATVVIGPVSFGTDVPEILEGGGSIKVNIAKRGQPARLKTVRMKARPFMGPAAETARERIPEAFERL